MWFKKNKWKIIIPVLVVAVLAAAFYFGGNAPGAKGWAVSSPTDAVGEPTVTPAGTLPDASPVEAPEPSDIAAPTDEPDETTAPEETPEETVSPTATPTPDATESAPEGYEWRDGMLISVSTGKDKYLTDPVPEGKPLPVEPQDVVIGATAYTCTLSISCSTILDNMDLCDAEKKELVPEDGWILKPTTVTFYAGESVFNVLQRTCKQLKIHMEFENTPMYNSAYIEGIHNLYEFDVGDLSGWMYKVNEWFPNYGCSRYQLKDGDTVCWVYTCDLGYDVGGGYAVG